MSENRIAEILTRQPEAARLWLLVAAQRKRLGMAARRMLSQGGLLALRGVPDLSLELMMRLAHGAMLAQGAESWTSSLDGHRVHRYAFAGHGDGPAVLLLHGLGGSASSLAPLVPALVPLARRVVLLELPGHGRSPEPVQGPLAAREYGSVAIACAEEMAREQGGKVVLVGNSLGGALALYAAHERPDLAAGVVGLNPAGAELSDEAAAVLPDAVGVLAGRPRLRPALGHAHRAAHPRRCPIGQRPFAGPGRAHRHPRSRADPLGRAGPALAAQQPGGFPPHRPCAGGDLARLRTSAAAGEARCHAARGRRFREDHEIIGGRRGLFTDRRSGHVGKPPRGCVDVNFDRGDAGQ